jgi:hypothetical protein
MGRVGYESVKLIEKFGSADFSRKPRCEKPANNRSYLPLGVSLECSRGSPKIGMRSLLLELMGLNAPLQSSPLLLLNSL